MRLELRDLIREPCDLLLLLSDDRDEQGCHPARGNALNGALVVVQGQLGCVLLDVLGHEAGMRRSPSVLPSLASTSVRSNQVAGVRSRTPRTASADSGSCSSLWALSEVTCLN